MITADEIEFVNQYLSKSYVSGTDASRLSQEEYSKPEYESSRLNNQKFNFRHSSMDAYTHIDGQRIERPSHGIVHTLRVCKYIPLVIKLFEEIEYPGIKQIDVTDLERMALFSVVGRQNDLGWSDHLPTYKFFRWRSAEIFKNYYKNKYDEATLNFMAANLEDMGNPENKNLQHIILNIAHKLDLYRVDPTGYEIRCKKYIEEYVSKEHQPSIDRLCQDSIKLIENTDWRYNSQNFKFITNHPIFFYQNNIQSVRQYKNKLLNEIEESVKTLESKELFTLYDLIIAAKYDKGNKYSILWNQHNILKNYKNSYGKTRSGEQALKLIHCAIKKKFDLENIKEIIPQEYKTFYSFYEKYLAHKLNHQVQGPMYLNVGASEDENFLHNDHYPIKNVTEIHVYRGDSRSPAEIISSNGFHPRKLKHKGIIKHTKENILKVTNNFFRAGGISTSQNLKVAHSFGTYIYRIKLLPGQATDVNATLASASMYSHEKEMLIIGGIPLGQIETQIKGKWYSLEDLKNKELKVSNAIDLSEELLQRSSNIIKQIFNDDQELAKKMLNQRFSLQQVVILLNENNALITSKNFNKLITNNDLRNAVIALKTSDSNIEITVSDFDIISESSNLRSAIIALWRVSPDLINVENWSKLKNDEQLQKSIIALWLSNPSLINEENWKKITESNDIKSALSGACTYINKQNMLFSQFFKFIEFIDFFKLFQFCYFHQSIPMTKKFITQIVQSEDKQESIIETTREFIDGLGVFAGRSSSDGLNSRRIILGSALNYNFSKNKNMLFIENNDKGKSEADIMKVLPAPGAPFS